MAKQKETELERNLNNLAKNLMDKVPNDIKSQTEVFCREVAKSVQSVLEQAERKVLEAEIKVEAIEKRMTKEGQPEDEKFLLINSSDVNGTRETLYRQSDPKTALYCIRYKKNPDQPTTCGAHCAGFKKLNDGNVEICNGSIRQIVR